MYRSKSNYKKQEEYSDDSQEFDDDEDEEFDDGEEEDENEYDDSEEDEDQDDSDDEEEEIKKQLSNVSFSTLVKLKKKEALKPKAASMVNGGITPQQKRSSANQFKDRSSGGAGETKNRIQEYQIKRENKDAPVEMTAMKPVSRYRQVISGTKKTVRDPRFNNLSGNFDEETFRKRYHFLDDVVKKDIEKLNTIYKGLDDSFDPKEKEKLARIIQSKKSQLQSQQIKDKKRDLKNRLLEKEIESVKKGKAPYHISNKTFKEVELQEKFKQLKETNRLGKFMEGRREKFSHKEKVFLPKRRSHQDD
ncbi:hypothetical protein CYY_007341 [Polysphondylium violaceum]|uniref:rRNA biogenesis protein RRP36 n=1 Tax=Polysphondylium violaceum TaxID=133409 RepID=A0A8J4PPC3_9MYCE|nr:hypothetical protein CYY_007341 [Polysphondylium violaceum]